MNYFLVQHYLGVVAAVQISIEICVAVLSTIHIRDDIALLAFKHIRLIFACA